MKKENIIKIPLTKIQKLKEKHKTLLIIIGLLLIVLIILFSLTGKKDNNENKPESKPNVKEETKEEKDKINIVNVNTKSRPFAVMINNHPSARVLQSGLQEAYIVYEMIVEGGMTRYMALFLDANTKRIGSIRSARHYYLDYALENDAIYVHHGTSPQAQNDFSALNIDRVEVSENKTAWREKHNVAWEHRLFTNIESIQKGLKNKRIERKNELLLDYKSDVDLKEMENSIKANNIKIPYSSNTITSYKYNENEKVYYRYVNDKEHTDFETKKQFNFKNIITYQVKNYTLDDPEKKGRQGLENVGSGSGYYISDGYAIKINWKKECRECQTKYTHTNGEELKVNDGNTFIQIQPINKELIIE